MYDIPGEEFREARNSTAACERLSELKRADHLALVIDGAKVMQPTQRHEALRNSKLLLQRFLDSKMLGQQALIHVLFTKYDLIKPHEASGGIKEFLESAETTMRNMFERRVAQLRFFKVAARPRVHGFGLAHGLEGVIPLWVEETPFRGVAQLTKPLDLPVVREIDRYLKRRIPGLPIER
jgi:hypothetical protein